MKPSTSLAVLELPRYRRPYATCLSILALGMVLLLAGNAVASSADLQELQTAVKQSPQDADAWYALGNYHYGQRDFSEAEQQFLRAVSLDKTHARSLFKLGNIYFHTGRLSKAEGAFKAIIAAGDKHAAPHQNLGTIYEQRRTFSAALREYEEAKTLAPDNPGGLFGMGDVYYRMEEWDKAIASYEAGLKLMLADTADEEDRQDRAITEKYLKMAREIKANGGVVPADQIYQDLAAPSGTRDAASTATAQGGVVLRKVLFATNKFSCESLDADSCRQLDELAKALRKLQQEGGLALLIEGHTDSRGNPQYNQTLSLKRAESIREYLVKSEVSGAAIRVKGLGSSNPACAENDANALRLNRRVVVKRLASAPPAVPVASANDSSSSATLSTPQPEPVASEAPGLSIRALYQDAQGKTCELAKGAKLPAGAQYRIEIEPSATDSKFLMENCYVYVLREGGKGAVECIFPVPFAASATAEGANPIPADKWTSLPAKETFYSMAPDKSLVIRFYTSSKPIDSLEDLLAEGTEVATIRRKGILAMPEPDRPVAAPPTAATEVGERPETVETPRPAGRMVSPAVVGSLPKPAGKIEIEVE